MNPQPKKHRHGNNDHPFLDGCQCPTCQAISRRLDAEAEFLTALTFGDIPKEVDPEMLWNQIQQEASLSLEAAKAKQKGDP